MIPNDDSHIKFMHLALQLAERARGTTSPNPMVGCLIVKNREIIGSGYHQQAGHNHAEINAIQSLSQANLDLSITQQADCYITLEPCCHYGRTAPCVEQIIKYKFKTVIVAMVDPNPLVAGKGIAALKAAGINVIVGVCEQAARDLNKGFITRIAKNRPYIRSKIAASLDGCIALENGESQWITNEAARQDVHLLRLFSDAVVTTASTILADNPTLNVRLNSELKKNIIVKQPVRVVIDKTLMTNITANIYNQDIAKTIIITSNASLQSAANADKINSFQQQGVALYAVQLNKIDNRFNMLDVWSLLAELGCNDVMIEAGSVFNSYLLLNNCVDEWIIYQSGMIMGNSARKMFSIKSEDSMSKVFQLECKDVRQLGDNWRLRLSQE